MIDIHSHILWGLDDGTETLEDSVRMLQNAFATGTTDIVATPHANDDYVFRPEIIEERIAELRARPEQLPRIHRGCDFHLSTNNVEDALQNPTRYTINGKRYLLVEFPDLFIPPVSDHMLHSLQRKGMTPIITHPERHTVLQQDPSRVRNWVDEGCLVQITGFSLLGKFGKEASASGWTFIESGCAHIVASDAHNPTHRHARLDKARTAVEERLGRPVADSLFVINPNAVINGEEVLPMHMPRPKRRWFWR